MNFNTKNSEKEGGKEARFRPLCNEHTHKGTT